MDKFVFTHSRAMLIAALHEQIQNHVFKSIRAAIGSIDFPCQQMAAVFQQET